MTESVDVTRSEYEAPGLVVIGSLHELTLQGQGNPKDGPRSDGVNFRTSR